MNLYPLAAISLLTMGAPLVAHAMDAPPTAPTNLTAQFYSGAGAEIFWDRSHDDQTVIGYDITINGHSIGIQDVLSYYDSSIADGTELTVTVVAVDNEHQRSDVAAFFGVSDSSAFDSSNLVDLGDDTNPPADMVPDEILVSIPDSTLTGLSIVRYSPTAAELFWDRSTTSGLRYEVARDDVVLGTTDGTSFFDSNLSASEPFHNYTVTAIDSNDNFVDGELIVLSASANVGGTPMRPSRDPSENGEGGTNTSNASLDDDSGLAGLSITRYSPTAAELFWDRSSIPGIEYEILRDSELIGVTNGTSFFDGNLSADVSFHEYAVLALDVSGNSIEGSAIIVLNAGASTGSILTEPGSQTPIQLGDDLDANANGIPDSREEIIFADDVADETAPTVSGDINTLLTSVGPGSPLSVDNSRAFLDALFLLANAEPAQEIQNRFIGVYQEALDAQNGVAGSRFVSESTSDTTSTFTCPEGGSYTFGASEFGTSDHAFDQCLFDGVSLDGEMFLTEETFSETAAPEFIALGDFDGRLLTYTDEEGVTYELERFFYYEDIATGLLGRFIWGGDIVIRSGDRILIVTDQSGGTRVEGKNTLTDANAIPPYSSYRTNFIVTGTLTNGRTINVNTLSDFRRFGQTENYTAGLLDVREEGVGTLSITADSSLPDAFTVRVDTNGEVDQYNQDWTDNLDFIKRDVPAQAE